MGRPIRFEIHATHPEVAMAFYAALFGWKFTPWGTAGYWLVQTGDAGQDGINGGLVQRRGPPPEDGQPVNAYPCTVGVGSVDEALAKVVALGGRIAVPRTAVPGVGWVAYAKDTEGNLFGLHQRDASAR